MSTLIDNLVKALQVQDEAETNKPIITTLTSPEVIKKIGEALQPSKNPQPAYNFPQDINLAPNKTLMRQQPFGKQIMGISPQARVNTMTPEQAEWHNLVEEFSQGDPQVAAGLDIEKAKRDEQAEFANWKAEKEAKKLAGEEAFKLSQEAHKVKSEDLQARRERNRDARATLDAMRSKGVSALGIPILADINPQTYLNLLAVIKVKSAIEAGDDEDARSIVASSYGLDNTEENKDKIDTLVDKAYKTTNPEITDAILEGKELPIWEFVQTFIKKVGGEKKPKKKEKVEWVETDEGWVKQ